MDLWRAGLIALREPKTVYNVRVIGFGVAEFKHMRPVRKFKKGYKVIAMGGLEGTVVGYTQSGRVQIDVDGTEWTCDEDALTLKTESFFGGFVNPYNRCFDIDFEIETAERVMPGELIFMDTDGMRCAAKADYCACPVAVAKIEVQASKDMEPEEKLEKVKEFAKALGVDVNEITGRKGCIGLVVRK